MNVAILIIENLRNFQSSCYNNFRIVFRNRMIMDQKDENAIVDPELGSQKDHIPTKSTINLVSESCNDISNGSKYPNSKNDVLKGWMTGLARFLSLLLLLYLFICSLTFLTDAFRLLAGKNAGTIFSGDALKNPIVGVMIGVLFTVLVQSSSTCTSVIVALVSSSVIDVETAIPMVMGANIGTSMTSTLVSLTQIGEADAYERAFSAATVHDCFNWLSVITLLIVEVLTGFLNKLSGAIVGTQGQNTTASGGKIKLLKTITEPLTNTVIQIDKKVLECWGKYGSNATELELKCGPRLLKEFCNKNSTEKVHCEFLFNIPDISDVAIGGILLVISLGVLTLCLLLIVKVLKSLLEGSMANLLKKFINADIPYIPWITGYIAIAVGAVMTFIVQSSSVFSSTLTPLVGVGMITVERVYPLLLGSNIGTTTTAFLAALTEGKKEALQIALVHLIFNLTGILIFYPIPFMRWPLGICKMLGRTTARYRWFALFYLFLMFFLLPGATAGLSLVDPTSLTLMVILIPSVIILTIVIIINIIQSKQPISLGCVTINLPKVLSNWDFLPLWMHSLDPIDKLLRKVGLICCGCCAQRCSCLTVEPDTPEIKVEHKGESNSAFEGDISKS